MDVEHLKELLSQKNREIERLKAALEKRDSYVYETETENQSTPQHQNKFIERYSRQLLLPEIGVEGQRCLSNCSALIVGAGGLGCPVGMYLAACGIGRLGIVDYDKVEISNLHRQVLHTEETVGYPKCLSFVSAIKRLNSSVECTPYEVLLNSSNVGDIIKCYTVVVDCSDNAPTRYLLNDACVFADKPLVSGSALRFEGHLTVYNYADGPCYRCLFPQPLTSSLTTNCSDGGVLGMVTGVIGCLQALEVIKLCAGLCPSYNKKLLLFDGKTGEFRSVKLRGKKLDCAVCGTNPTIQQFIDYESFCQASATDRVENISLLSSGERVSCVDYKKMQDKSLPHVLLDVRPENEFKICSLPWSVNIPYLKLNCEENLKYLEELVDSKGTKQHYVICRRGNDSQKAVQVLKEGFKDKSMLWQDIKGGLTAWHNEIDVDFPMY